MTYIVLVVGNLKICKFGTNLREYCTPDQKLACFVLYLKIIQFNSIQFILFSIIKKQNN